MADALCSIATGSGVSESKMYVNGEVWEAEVTRPIILNGIGHVVTRSDLLDRCVTLEFSELADNKRRDPDELWNQFLAILPKLLGGLFTVVCQALKVLPYIELKKSSRMIGYAKWGEAVAVVLSKRGKFTQALAHSLEMANTVALESSPIVNPLLEFLKSHPNGYESSAADWLSVLRSVTTRQLPTSARGFSAALDHITPNLQKIGLQVSKRRTTDSNRIRLIKIKPDGPDANRTVRKRNRPVKKQKI